MNDITRSYSISGRYLRNLWLQALCGGGGILSSWSLFLLVSLWLVPAIPLDQLWRLPIRIFNDPRLWIMPASEEIRELIRFGTGPAMAFCALISGLADFSSWVAIRYEISADRLRMRWRRFTREVSWDLIQTVDERPHADVVRSSLRITQSEKGVVLVRGLDKMIEFVQLVRSQLPRHARWSVSPARIDLTSGPTNFGLGFLLFIPFSASWIAYYFFHSNAIGLFWSLVLLVAAFWIFYRRPLSRPHMCVREVEVLMAVMIALLSGVMTLIGWLESPPQMAFSRLFGW
jgi:hypothetical protein